jgi:hypothetical protein
MCDEIIARSRVYMESLRLPDALEEIERCVGLLPSPSQTKIMRVLELLDPSVNDPTADYRAVELLYELTEENYGKRLERLVYLDGGAANSKFVRLSELIYFSASR